MALKFSRHGKIRRKLSFCSLKKTVEVYKPPVLTIPRIGVYVMLHERTVDLLQFRPKFDLSSYS